MGGGTAQRGLRAWNMPCMSVMLEVSQLSGWLKACAFCAEGRNSQAEGVRAAGRGLRAGREARGGGPGAGGGRRCVCTQRAEGTGRDCRLGGTQGAAHSKHLVHVCDARRVPAEGLVEGLRALPRVVTQVGHIRAV